MTSSGPQPSLQVSEPGGQTSEKCSEEAMGAIRPSQRRRHWRLQGWQSTRNSRNSNWGLRARSRCRDKDTVNSWCLIAGCSPRRWGGELIVWRTLMQRLFVAKFVCVLSRVSVPGFSTRQPLPFFMEGSSCQIHLLYSSPDEKLWEHRPGAVWSSKLADGLSGSRKTEMCCRLMVFL